MGGQLGSSWGQCLYRKLFKLAAGLKGSWGSIMWAVTGCVQVALSSTTLFVLHMSSIYVLLNMEYTSP